MRSWAYVLALVVLAATCGVHRVEATGKRFSDGSKPIKRSEILTRARRWVNANVPYNSLRWSHEYLAKGGNKYRMDCSGFVSMAWKLDTSYRLRSLEKKAPCRPVRKRADLKPGDIFINKKHTMMFNGWVKNSGMNRFYTMEAFNLRKGAIATIRKVDRKYRMCRYSRVQEDNAAPLSLPVDKTSGDGDGDEKADHSAGGMETTSSWAGGWYDAAKNKISAAGASIATVTNSVFGKSHYAPEDDKCTKAAPKGLKGTCIDAQQCFDKRDKGFKIVRKCGGPTERICCTKEKLPKGVKAETDLAFVNGEKSDGEEVGFFDNLISSISSTAGETPQGFFHRVGIYQVENLDRTDRGTTMPVFSSTVNKFLLHTIEGRWPRHGDYDGGTRVLDKKRAWPHFIVGYNGEGEVKIGQYLPLSVGGRALRAHNALGAIQVEIGAKAASPFTEHDTNLTQAVAMLWAALSNATKGVIPLSVDASVTFEGSQKAYGKKAPVRLTKAKFKALSGLCGHQHVPDNTHWDPGKINATKLLEVAKKVKNPVTLGTGASTSSANGEARVVRTAGIGGGLFSAFSRRRRSKPRANKRKKPVRRLAKARNLRRTARTNKRNARRSSKPVARRTATRTRRKPMTAMMKKKKKNSARSSRGRSRARANKRRGGRSKPIKKSKRFTLSLSRKPKKGKKKKNKYGTPMSPIVRPMKRGAP